MKNYSEIEPQVRHEEFELLLNELKCTPEEITDAITLITKFDKIWALKLDTIIVILLAQIQYVLKDLDFEGTPCQWLDRLIDFGVSRESKIVFDRFEQTRRLVDKFIEMDLSDPEYSKYQAELNRRGII